MKSMLLALSLGALTTLGAEYFVSTSGNDAHSGLAQDQAFRTLTKAKESFKPGDTITIMPGTYHESLEFANFPTSDKTSTIRALIPGTVLIRGDIDPPAPFQPSETYPNVWTIQLDSKPTAVNERDTLTIYATVPTLQELEFTSAAWFYDNDTKKLHVRTSDSLPPKNHTITIGRIPDNGVAFWGSKVANIVIRDLVITGFNAPEQAKGYGFGTRWGIYLSGDPTNCRIENITAFLNGGGITVNRNGRENHIVNCKTYGNHSPFYASGGGIIVLTPNERGSIQDCISFDTEKMGIRYYGGTPAEHCKFQRNIAFDCTEGALWIKYPSDTTIAEDCYSDAALYARKIENSIFSHGDTGYFGAAQNSIVRSRDKDFSENNDLADPINFDFRPQADSAFKDKLPKYIQQDIFFVAPNGNDSAPGTSLKTAWKTIGFAIGKLKPGATLYILPGTWNENLVLDGLQDVAIRGRGHKPVSINANINAKNTKNLQLARLDVNAIALDNASETELRHCIARTSATFQNASNLDIKNSTFLGDVKLDQAPNHIVANNVFAKKLIRNSTQGLAFANAHAQEPTQAEYESFTIPPPKLAEGKGFVDGLKLLGGRGFDGLPAGHYWRQAIPTQIQIRDFKTLSSTVTTANLEAFATMPVEYTLTYAPQDNPQDKKSIQGGMRSNLISAGINGLQPNTTYNAQITLKAKAKRLYTNQDAAESLFNENRDLTIDNISFKTIDHDRQSQTFHVAKTGNDQTGDGTRKNPWKTISHAAKNAVAGDTVFVHPGTYLEMVRFKATGEQGKPIVFRGINPHTTCVDGGKRQLASAFVIHGKHNIVIDNFGLKWQADSSMAAVDIRNANNIRITRLFYDGRGAGYAPHFVGAVNAKNLEVDNCFLTRGFNGSIFRDCDNLLIRNNVFYINSLNQIVLSNNHNQKSVIRNNVFTDNTLQKVPNPIIHLRELNGVKIQDNCFFLRIPTTLKTLVGFSNINGIQQDFFPPVEEKGILPEQWKRQGRFARVNLTYEQFQKQVDYNPNAIFEDPKLDALKQFVTFKDWNDWTNFGQHSATANKHEWHNDGSRFKFPDDFIADNPTLQKADIGLQKDYVMKHGEP